MDYQMVVLDLDGTLTNVKKEITPRTKEILTRYMEQGGIVTLASGRPIYGIVPLAEELELKKYGGYILAFNGGQIVNCRDMETVYQKKFPAGFPQKLNALAREFRVTIMTYEDEYIITETPEDYYVKKESFINKMKVKKIGDFDSYVNFPVTKCLMTEDEDYLAEVEERVKRRVGDACSVLRSEPFFLEIMPKGIDKAASLERLSEILSIGREHMAAFGDGFNDKSMIEYAGLGVAMANAQEEVKKAADLVTLSNEEDGVAAAMERWVLAG